MAERYSAMSVKQLQAELRKLGVSVSGRKAELVDRLIIHNSARPPLQAVPNSSLNAAPAPAKLCRAPKVDLPPTASQAKEETAKAEGRLDTLQLSEAAIEATLPYSLPDDDDVAMAEPEPEPEAPIQAAAPAAIPEPVKPDGSAFVDLCNEIIELDESSPIWQVSRPSTQPISRTVTVVDPTPAPKSWPAEDVVSLDDNDDDDLNFSLDLGDEEEEDFSNKPVPPGWTMSRTSSGMAMYRNATTGQVSLVHPLAMAADASPVAVSTPDRAQALLRAGTLSSAPAAQDGLRSSAADVAVATGFKPRVLMEEASTPMGMRVKLMKHQRIALAWMIRQEHSKVKGGILADDMGCGKTITSLALMLANPVLPLTEPQRNLVIAPLTCLLQWKAEIMNKADGQTLCNICIYHGSAKAMSVKRLAKYDVVITTHATLASGCEIFQNEVIGKSKLHQLKWHRVLLDEAHYIKNRRTKASAAAVGLNARYRWALTGTPVQNVLGDLHTLITFLRFNPWADVKYWREYMAGPIARNPTAGFLKLRELLKKLLLRREKSDPELQAMLQLPEKIRKDVQCEFTENERKFYDELEHKYRGTIMEYRATGAVMANYAHVFSMLHHLRRACCHPVLCITAMKPRLLSIEKQERLMMDNECSICMDVQDKPTATTCGHGFCEKCIKEWLQMSRVDGRRPICPNCNAMLSENSLIPMAEALGQDDEDSISAELENMRESSKINLLMERLSTMLAERPRPKVVVVSQWTSFLKLIGKALDHRNIKWLTIDGSMPMQARANASKQFGEQESVSVMLLSMRGAGVGIDLTMANKVLLMDPWWNPAAEEQAIDRVHRIGQTLPVEVFKITVKDTLEDRILKLQEVKLALADGALGKDAESLLQASMKLSVADICQLFGIRERDRRSITTDDINGADH